MDVSLLFLIVIKYNINFIILAIFRCIVQWFEYLHTVMQSSPLSISRTFSSAYIETL